jgi:hypothetical protein
MHYSLISLFAELAPLKYEALSRRELFRVGSNRTASSVLKNLARRAKNANTSFTLGALVRLTDNGTDSFVEATHGFKGIDRKLVVRYGDCSILSKVPQCVLGNAAEFTIDCALKAAYPLQLQLQRTRNLSTGVDVRR